MSQAVLFPREEDLVNTRVDERQNPVFQAYFSALYNQQSGNNEPMKRFKEEYPDIFTLINQNYHKRKTIRENVYAMRECGSRHLLVCGTLTYDDDHDEQSDKTKRQQALRHLGKNMSAYLFVEELGEQYGRYHLHFIGLLHEGVSYLDFLNGWHSRAEIVRVKKVISAVNYLTDYVSKQAPRIRRNKVLIQMFNHWKKSKSWSARGFKESFAREELQNARILLAMGL